MTLKRVGSLKNKKHKHCLQCGRVLVGLKDNTHIRYSKKVTAWTYENGQSLLETTPRSAATRDYKNLVLEYMGKRG